MTINRSFYNLLKIVLSTVGTSLLTNQIDRQNPEESGWFKKLSDRSNLTNQDTPEDVLNIIEQLKIRAINKLEHGNTAIIRRASAELNGIYGIYNNDLELSKQDLHYLIATDTAQGRATAEIIQTFLLKKGFSVNIYMPPGFSTASTATFSEGIDNLLVWLREDIYKSYKNTHKIYFNLVGGFKSMQGYMNTLGMFYADAIIYIFEGQNSELITIPRLPISIAVDRSTIEPYKVQLALMNAGAELKLSEVEEIPESLVYVADKDTILSTWGKLVWGECKDEILAQELLQFPRLVYQQTFIEDYKKTKDKDKRVKLQETLAKTSHLLVKHHGDHSILRRDGGILYETYTGKHSDIDHFRVTQNARVSCVLKDGKLSLRHYGEHDYVNDNP
jgi:putative CRISPR-associated protein (TIGR02619 family)